MEKLIFIALDLGRDLGTNMHYKALCEAYGEENVIVYDFYPDYAELPARRDNYIAFGKYRNAADRLLRWAQGNTMYISDSIIRRICGDIRSMQVKTVFMERPLFAKLARRIKKTCPGVKTVTFYHDINADLYRQWRRTAPMKDKIEFTLGMRQERLTAKNCDVNLVLNRRDAELYRSVYGKAPEGIVPLSTLAPAIPEEAKDIVTPADAEKKILFVGAYYGPNLTGLDWFCEHVLPGVTAPIRFNVVGRGLEALRGKYADSRVNIIGGVEDLGAYYVDADIVIAPLFDGGGMKQKTVEAFSYGKVFLGTQESLSGFRDEVDDTVRDRSIFERNTPEEWIDTLNALGGGSVRKYNRELHDFFLKKFSYEALRDVLLRFVK